MVTLHLGRVAERVSRVAMGRNAAFVRRTPRSYTAVVSRTIGRSPRHVIVPAHRSTSATDDSNAPFQCRSRIPQHRSIGLYEVPHEWWTVGKRCKL